MDRNKVKALAQHYAYAAVTAVISAYAAGYHSAKDLGIAAVSAIVAPILVALDPSNALLGIHSAPKVVQIGAEAGLKNKK